MKKFLSLALTLCLLIGSISVVLVVPASADGTDNDYFEDASNWYYFSKEIPSDKTAWTQKTSGWPSISKNTSSDHIKSGTVSLKYYGNNSAFYIPLDELKQNYKYTLSFYYKSATVGTTSSNDTYIIANSGIYTSSPQLDESEAKVTGFEYTSDGYLVYRGRYTGYTNPTGNYSSSSRIYNGSLMTTSPTVNGWNYIEYTFDSAEYTDLYFVLSCVVADPYTVYFDEFTLTEHKKDNEYFETNTNWYSTGAIANAIPTDKTTWTQYTSSWNSLQSMTNNTSFVKSGTKSLKSYSQNRPFFIPLTGLKEHSNYTLSFYYKSTNVMTYSASNPASTYMIAGSGIYTNTPQLEDGEERAVGVGVKADGYLLYRGRDGGYTNPTANYSSSSRVEDSSLKTFGAVANEWNYIEYTFDTATYKDLYFVFYIVQTTDNTVYFDEFELTLNSTDSTVLQTSYNSKAAIRAASNTDGSIASNGLRTYNAIKSDWVDAADSSIVEFGSIAIREGYMEKKFPTKSAPDLDMLSLQGKGVGLGVSYRSAATVTGSDTITSTLWENNNTDGVFATDIFTAYLTGIDAANYGEEYLVRAYAIDASGNIYYGDTASVSIFKVAQAISAENDSSKIIDQDAFKAFVGGQTTAYETWCNDNGLAVGDLYTALYAG